MKIEIWSDIACPYCYIGKRKLEKALDKFSHKNDVEIEWHSYELNPDLPKKALDVPFPQYFSQSHDSTAEETEKTLAAITRMARIAGLDYHFEKLIVANTSDALRLIKLAAESGLATQAEEVIFEAYFVKGLDVSDPSVLTSLGKQIGLDESDIEAVLNSNRYADDIKKDMEYSENHLNLEYIPFYRFNGKQIIQGSVTEEDYEKVLAEAYEEWKTGKSNGNTDIVSGKSCSIDGVCSI